MALKVQARLFKSMIAVAGVLGFSLRAVLYTTGTDGKGLLIAGHWAGSGAFLLTAAVAVMLLLWCRGLNSTKDNTNAYPPSVLSAAGSIAAGCALLLCRPAEVPSAAFAIAEPFLRLTAAASLLYVAFCRFTGRKPQFLFHGCVCLYLGLRLVCQYRIWSVVPQMQNYCFFLGAHVALMLTCYQLAAFDAGFGNHRKLWGAGLATVYLAIVSLYKCAEPFFLLCCAFWIWTNLSCQATPKYLEKFPSHHTDQEDSV